MDYYEIWCNLREGQSDLEFCEAVAGYMGHLRDRGLIEGYSLRRRKLGFGPPGLGEFNITIHVRSLVQLEGAFQAAATRSGEIEALHRAVYGAVQDLTFRLSRDFPDPVRKRPEP